MKVKTPLRRQTRRVVPRPYKPELREFFGTALWIHAADHTGRTFDQLY
jgi:hypothetical protein